MPTPRFLLLTLTLSALVSAGVAWTVTRQVHLPQDVAKAEMQLPPKEAPPASDQQIEADLRSFVPHPDDHQNPASKNACSDDEIAEMNGDAARDFIERANSILTSREDPAPDLCFALGRVALLHHSLEIARRYLTKAATNSYGAAYGYLGDPELAHSPYEQWTNYTSAEKLGFTPAREWKAVLEEKAISAIERYTADPQDPALPEGVIGISNSRIMALDTSTIVTLLEDFGFYAKAKGAPPHLAYGLGRAAFLHQMLDSAKEYLTLAAQNGSVAASAYLAFPEITTDLDRRIVLLKKAADGKYIPAQRMLKDALELKERIPTPTR